MSLHDSGSLVTTAWLADHLDDPDLCVLDCRVRLAPDPSDAGYKINSAADDYAASHVPNAVHADLLALSDADAALPFMMPSPELFAAELAKRGVSQASKVVLYDDLAHMWSARMWWMLRSIGHEQVSVLDGGWGKWSAEGRPTSSERPEPTPGDLSAKAGPLWASLDDVVSASEERSALLVNALDPEQFAGTGGVHMGRRGRIPGSTNVPGFSLIDPETGAFRHESVLREAFAEALTPRPVITYCNAGILAASDAFALHLLGKQDVRVYDGSLVEWASDASRPLATDATDATDR